MASGYLPQLLALVVQQQQWAQRLSLRIDCTINIGCQPLSVLSCSVSVIKLYNRVKYNRIIYVYVFGSMSIYLLSRYSECQQ